MLNTAEVHSTLSTTATSADAGEVVRALAFHLPQFHPIRENDEWWGKGFTEWTNVARSQPLFHGHYQPHIPADLGFYDLRVPEVRAAQAELAGRFGIHGFCYYHYWFHGQRLLERPVNEILASGQPDFPFCLCWANEPWSRRWLGEQRDVLMEQRHSKEDDVAHARWLACAFADPRYIRVAGRPLFLIYRPTHLPDPQGTAETLRTTVMKEGLPDPWLVGVDAHCLSDTRELGLDWNLAFEPQLSVLPDFMDDRPTFGKWRRNLRQGVLSSRLKLYDDAEARRAMNRIARTYPHYPCCYVGWDNSPRRGANGIVFINPAMDQFERDLAAKVEAAHKSPGKLVFINAWNEWAEGNHLEPDLKHGHAYLEAVRRVMSKQSAKIVGGMV